MNNLDLTFVRQQFPAFEDKSLVHAAFFENAGGSYMCKQVMDRLVQYYHQCKVQPYYPNPVSGKAGSMMDEAYSSLAKWLNVDPTQLYFGPSTSQNTYVLSNSMLNWLQPNDEIIVTNQDHEANIGSWRRLEVHGVIVKEWQVNPTTGSLEIENLQALISPKTKLLTFPHCSNILGEINPVFDICQLARNHGIKTVVDGVSFAGHGLPNICALNCDIYLFSLYKVYGPHQGVMAISDSMAKLLTNQGHFFNHDSREKTLMPAGPDHAQIAAIKGLADYFETLYHHHFPVTKDTSDQEKAEKLRLLFADAEHEVVEPLLRYLQQHDHLEMLGPNDCHKRAATISVVPKNHNPIDLAQSLGKKGILCGAGHFYSVRLLEALGVNTNSGVLRFSLVHYTSKEDVKKLISELDKLL